MIDKVFTLTSLEPMTPYAPNYKYFITRAIWDETEKINKIKKYLLSKEKHILQNINFNNDGGTGLNTKDLTSRHSNYNVFDFIEELPELNDLLNFIKKTYLEYIKISETQEYKLKINCWFNVLRKGQKMKMHTHGGHAWSYLSGNIHLDNYHTKTSYQFIDKFVSLDNVKGSLAIFPNVISHETSEYKDDEPRVSIAFDLHLKAAQNLTEDVQYRDFNE